MYNLLGSPSYIGEQLKLERDVCNGMGIAIFVMNIFICGSYSKAVTISANP